MLFTSFVFIAFVLVLLIIYYAVPSGLRWYVLLAGSLAFFAFAGLTYLLYIVLTIGSAYGATMIMRRLRLRRDTEMAAADREARRKIKAGVKSACLGWLVACLLLNFGLMFIFKYADTPLGFVIRLGVSFYTFQLMGYVIDVYREKAKPETNILRLALFASFFPLLIQGPINRYHELTPTLYEGAAYDPKNLGYGAWRVLWGFFKKLIIADRLAPAMNALLGGTEPGSGVYAALGMLLYAITLYADFTGGIDITVGVAEMFGVRVTENFDRPFYATNVAEYWRRWHITMGTWFKDYLFYPLSVCKPMLKLSKLARGGLGDAVGKRVTVYLCLLAVWLATGLWHDATWNYVVWGLTNGAVLLISQELEPLYARFHGRFAWANTGGYRAFMTVRTFLLMGVIRSIDRYESVALAFDRIVSVFMRFDLLRLWNEGVADLGVSASGYAAAGLGLAVVLLVSVAQRGGVDIRNRLAGKSWAVRSAAVLLLFFMIVLFGAYGLGYDAQQFMYNKF